MPKFQKQAGKNSKSESVRKQRDKQRVNCPGMLRMKGKISEWTPKLSDSVGWVGPRNFIYNKGSKSFWYSKWTVIWSNGTIHVLGRRFKIYNLKILLESIWVEMSNLKMIIICHWQQGFPCLKSHAWLWQLKTMMVLTLSTSYRPNPMTRAPSLTESSQQPHEVPLVSAFNRWRNLGLWRWRTNRRTQHYHSSGLDVLACPLSSLYLSGFLYVCFICNIQGFGEIEKSMCTPSF